MTKPEETHTPEQPLELTFEVALNNLYLASREYPCNAENRDLLERSHDLLVTLLSEIARAT